MNRDQHEDGAVLLFVAATLVAILGIAALALDLATLRMDRSLATNVTDQAATAGIQELLAGDGQDACETALAYLDGNMPGGPFTGANCNLMPTSCSLGTAAATTTATSGSWTASITYPVPDGHALMSPAAIGATGQAVTADDGLRCERLGVRLDNTREYFFAQILGANSGDIEHHSVARGQPNDAADLVLNLLILERWDCDSLVAEGSGGGIGGIVTDAVFNTDTMQLDPGWAAVDSDGSGSGCSGDGVIDVDGSNAFIRADGPPGCPNQTGTHIGGGGLTVGEGCGEIRLLAPGTPGCNHPACTSSGTVNPDPEALPQRVTRAPVDHRYNCKGSYNFGLGWEIDPCTKSPMPPPHIDNLTAAYGIAGTSPGGFTRWSTLGHPCTVEGPPSTTITVSGNIHVDCANFVVKRQVYFTGGDVIFDGDVTIESAGTLAINSDVSGPLPFTPASSAAIAYVRNGEIHKAGQANLIMHRTVGYFSSSSWLTMQGGGGTLLWTAPTTGNFEDLALWSDGTNPHQFAGQALLELEGVFFTPVATAIYRGQGNQEQVSAQFIARKLRSTGQGLLIVRPRYDRAVLFPDSLAVQLIR